MEANLHARLQASIARLDVPQDRCCHVVLRHALNAFCMLQGVRHHTSGTDAVQLPAGKGGMVRDDGRRGVSWILLTSYSDSSERTWAWLIRNELDTNCTRKYLMGAGYGLVANIFLTGKLRFLLYTEAAARVQLFFLIVHYACCRLQGERRQPSPLGGSSPNRPPSYLPRVVRNPANLQD